MSMKLLWGRGSTSRVRLAIVVAFAVMSWPAAGARAVLVSAYASGGDIFMVDSLPGTISGSGTTSVPAGVNTSGNEGSVSLSADGRLLGFERFGSDALFDPSHCFVADRNTGRIVEIPVPSGLPLIGAFAISPDGTKAVFATDSSNDQHTTAVVVDLSHFPDGPFPELYRASASSAVGGTLGQNAIKASVGNSGAVAWTMSAGTNGVAFTDVMTATGAGTASRFPDTLQFSSIGQMRVVPGFAGLIGDAQQARASACPGPSCACRPRVSSPSSRCPTSTWRVATRARSNPHRPTVGAT
jgi:hypothetical protein